MEMFDKARMTAIEMGLESREEMKTEDGMDNIDDCFVREFDCSNNRTNVSSYLRDGNKLETKTKEDDEYIIGPPVPASLPIKITTSEKSNVNDEDDEDEDDKEEKENRLPLDNKLVINHGKKPISSLYVDASGAMLVTGSYDYSIKFWDFAGMDSSPRPFRTINPCEGHIIRDLKFSSNGDMVLVVSGSARAKVLDRDGHKIMECIKGDQYIIYQSNTKGHTATLNAGCKKVVTTTCSYSRDGKLVAAACQDGSIQMWEHGKLYVKVILKNMTAHGCGNDIFSISFSNDNNFLASRSTDDTLKLWDLRHFKKALFEVTSLYNLFPLTDCCFSPNDNLIVTGVSAEKGGSTVNGTGGKLVFYNKNTAAEKDRKDPARSRRPDLPVNGPGEDGKVRAHGATLSQYIIKNLALRKPDERDIDPRSAILRHAKEAAEHPFWITPAYQKTQPKPIFQEVEEDDDSSDELAPVCKKLKTKEK
ncbi:hypothetical protein HELRODRAFT_194479 [Helobdella robusta]|uniref:Uncharacterized protein n=1 Tax=Helobdella robusta TaxID=6412 RepID=T1FW37_HELRO|nr:hypothetical protein HELRODRAFT_194479 [Helobdella robusta]ESN92013.1 hypothetical protein HELRODRAFT_194479 [Helobdella robusta]